MRTAIYARISTVTHSQQHSIEEQINRLRACLLSRGEAVADEHIFRDEGRSGATLNRPALDRLRDHVRLGDYDCILVTSPDRLARNYVHQMLLLEELERAGCRVEFLDQPVNDTPHDHLLLQIRGAVAEYERALIGDRMRRGRLARYRAGLLLPWTRPVYGYLLDPERPRDPKGVRVSEPQAAVVRQIFAWYLEEGASLSSIVNRLFEHGIASPMGKPRWRHTTVRFLLRNPAYTGTLYACRSRARRPLVRRSALQPIGKRHNDSAAPRPREEWVAAGSIPALVTLEQYELVQEKLQRNRQFAARNNTAHDYLLRALISCGLCGLAATGRTAGVGYPYYVCAGKRPDGAGGGRRCRSRLTPAGQLDELVWADLCEVIREPQLIALELERAWGGQWLPEEMRARRVSLRQARVSLEQRLERLTEAYMGGVIRLEEYGRRRRELEEKTAAFESQERELEQQADRRMELGGMVSRMEDYCRRIGETLADASFEQKRRLVELLIDRVIVTEEEVEIRYVIPTRESGEHTHFCHLRTNYLPANAQKDDCRLEMPPLERRFGLFQGYDSRRVMIELKGDFSQRSNSCNTAPKVARFDALEIYQAYLQGPHALFLLFEDAFGSLALYGEPDPDQQQREIDDLSAHISRLKSQIEKLQTEITQLRHHNFRLARRNAELEAVVAKDSHDSSRPPSSDPPWAKRTKSLRRPSGKRPSGQAEHPGSTLQLSARPHRIVEHRPLACRRCYGSCDPLR